MSRGLRRWPVPILVLSVLLVALLVLHGGMAAAKWGWQRYKAPATAAATKPRKASKPAAQQPAFSPGLESKIMFVGDIYWGRSINKRAQASSLKEAFPFARLHEFDRTKYDAWIGNMECPSVPGVSQPYDLEVDKLLFNCPPSYLPELAKWFTAVSLANNHTANQNGQPGIEATRTALEAQKIQYFGHFDPRKITDVCEVVALPMRIKQAKATDKQARMPIALCGYHGVSVTPPAESLAVMKRYAAVMPVIAIPHMGTEYKATADPARQNVYRAMIDNGADAVLAAHPHWVQPAEAYKKKLIVYSMGNFMFDQPAGETQRGAAIDLTLSMPARAVSATEFTAWTQLAETCATFQDTCLAEAEQQHLSRLPLAFRYAAHAVDLSGGQTHPGVDGVQDAVLERLGWDSVAAILNKDE